MTTETATKQGVSLRVRVQKFGTFLSGMVMPNIGAFIAWGIITALFIPAGYLPNADLAKLVDPMITYLLPLLIAYTGGTKIYGTRGGVVGAAATMGVIVGTTIPMFIGAMIMGPLTAWIMKKVDGLWAGKIRPGFEMLVDNFSAGILAFIMAVLAFFGVGPAVTWFSEGAGKVVEFLVHAGLLPLTSIFIEPAKVLFLNNAINHGILTPLGTEEALKTGKSFLFLLEANPGPGLGILLAFMLFGKGTAKASAPGAAIIHFFGGIHEIYFPYVLMKPAIILAAMAGGATGIATLVITNSGLRSPAAPGSIIAVLAAAPPSSIFGVLLSVVLATAVSFLVGSIILKASKADEEGDLAGAAAKMDDLKGKKSSVTSSLTASQAAANGPINTIVFACDAGMGSSAMGASVLRNMIKDAGLANQVKVTNSAISNLSDTYDVVVTHQDLAARALPLTESAQHFAVDNFMNSPRYAEIVELTKASHSVGAAVPAQGPDAQAAGTTPAATSAATAPAAASAAAGAHAAAPAISADAPVILSAESIVLDGGAGDRAAAIQKAGELLQARGAVDADYVAAMHEREESVSTYMGNFLAIPHGTNEAKGHIKASAISVVRYPEGIDWGGKQVKFVIGIAGLNNEHLTILSKIAKIFTNKDQVAQLEAATSAEEVLELFGKVNA